MRTIRLALVLGLGIVPAALAQRGPAGPSDNPAYIAPRFDVSLGFDYMRANAPPTACNCFGTEGGYASGTYHLTKNLGVIGEFMAGHANNISALGQNLTLKTFGVGPRVSLTRQRLTGFGQATFGVGHGSDSYFPQGNSYSTSASSFMFTAGGGLDVSINKLISVRALEVQYLRTGFPNGTDNMQNHLALNSGIVFKFGGRGPTQPPAPPPLPLPAASQRKELNLFCSTNVVTLEAGQILKILSNATRSPADLDVSYTWTTTGGKIQGSGPEITIDTIGLQPGRYRVTAHATAAADILLTASCDLAFSVAEHHEPPAAVANPKPQVGDAIFHDNVKDAYFDFDKSDIRPDALVAIQHAAAFLNEHPSIRVLVGGYSDERGTMDYNLALGARRATAAREALIAAGVDAARLEIVSFGKGSQVCTVAAEHCWQQNRRAAFLMRP